MTYIVLFTITNTAHGSNIVMDRESHFLLEKHEVGSELCWSLSWCPVAQQNCVYLHIPVWVRFVCDLGQASWECLVEPLRQSIALWISKYFIIVSISANLNKNKTNLWMIGTSYPVVSVGDLVQLGWQLINKLSALVSDQSLGATHSTHDLWEQKTDINITQDVVSCTTLLSTI